MHQWGCEAESGEGLVHIHPRKDRICICYVWNTGYVCSYNGTWAHG